MILLLARIAHHMFLESKRIPCKLRRTALSPRFTLLQIHRVTFRGRPIAFTPAFNSLHPRARLSNCLL